MQYKKLLLTRLIDKYEKSRSYTDNTAGTRRILLKLLQDDFPEYDLEKPEVRETINSAIQEYAEKELVDFNWLKHEKGNIIEKVWLRLDSLERVYSEAGRTPKGDIVDKILSMVHQAQSEISSEWIKTYLSDLRNGIEQKRSAQPYLPDDAQYANTLFTALKAIDAIGREECLERVFSQRAFGDSKVFEKTVRKKTAGIIRKYLNQPSLMENLTDDEALCAVGIVKAPELFDFCGNLIVKMQNKALDFSPLIYGATINSKTASEMEITGLGPVKRILFIENKANYLDYLNRKKESDELVVYHGGFYSPVRGSFFRKLYQAGKREGTEFFHWSDIDLGGFHMFIRLRDSIIPELQPYFMDEAAFVSIRHKGMGFDNQYASLLEGLLEKAEYKIFHPVIQMMLTDRIRIEQEAFITSQRDGST